MTRLPTNPCRDLCAWEPGPWSTDPPRMRCRGCGSQWDRDEPWTPCDVDGSVPPAVAAERFDQQHSDQQRFDQQRFDQQHSDQQPHSDQQRLEKLRLGEPLTSGRGADAAGRGDS